MALLAGSVTGSGVGTGLAKELFDVESPAISGDSSLDSATKTALLAGLAARCTAHAGVIVLHMTTNATVATITACPAGAGTGAGTVT